MKITTYESELHGAAEACLCGGHCSNVGTVAQRDSRWKICAMNRGIRCRTESSGKGELIQLR